MTTSFVGYSGTIATLKMETKLNTGKETVFAFNKEFYIPMGPLNSGNIFREKPFLFFSSKDVNYNLNGVEMTKPLKSTSVIK